MSAQVAVRRNEARRRLLALVETAVTLQPGAEAALRDCLDPSVVKDAGLAGRVGVVTFGFGHLLGEVDRLPPAPEVEEAAGLIRYHHLLVTTTARHVFDIRRHADVEGKFTRELGHPGERLRQLRDALAEDVDRGASDAAQAADRSMRTPLTRILARSSTLSQTDVTWDEDTWRRLVSAITTESVRLGQVLDNVLCLALIEAGTFRPSFDYCEAAEIVTAAVRRVDRTLLLDTRLQVAVEAGTVFWSDHRLVVQALTELLDNAARHSGARTVTVSVRKAGRGVAISVGDDGIGMAAGLPCATTGGIGARTARELFRAMGATFDYASVGCGARACAWLPGEPQVVPGPAA